MRLIKLIQNTPTRQLWQMLHDHAAETVTHSSDNPPSAPYLAVNAYAAALKAPDMSWIEWLAVLEVDLAAAWIGYGR